MNGRYPRISSRPTALQRIRTISALQYVLFAWEIFLAVDLAAGIAVVELVRRGRLYVVSGSIPIGVGAADHHDAGNCDRDKDRPENGVKYAPGAPAEAHHGAGAAIHMPAILGLNACRARQQGQGRKDVAEHLVLLSGSVTSNTGGSEPQRIGDHGNRRGAHGEGGEHRTDEDAEQRIEDASRDRHACAVVDEREEQVLADVAHGGVGQAAGAHDAVEIAFDQRDPGAFDGDVRAGSHCDADIGLCQRRRVVDAVARHRDLTAARLKLRDDRSEEHTSELQSLMRISYAVFCLKKKTHQSSTLHITTALKATTQPSDMQS